LVRTHGVEVTFNRRFTRGWNMMLAYTGTKARAADWFPNPYDQRPAWEESNSSRPHRLTATGTYQFPFGRRKALFKSGVLGKVLGGIQVSGTFEYQSGARHGSKTSAGFFFWLRLPSVCDTLGYSEVLYAGVGRRSGTTTRRCLAADF